jgi:hypothetical protein
MKNANNTVPYTAKRRAVNPDRVWRGTSYRKGGARIRAVRDRVAVADRGAW